MRKRKSDKASVSGNSQQLSPSVCSSALSPSSHTLTLYTYYGAFIRTYVNLQQRRWRILNFKYWRRAPNGRHVAGAAGADARPHSISFRLSLFLARESATITFKRRILCSTLDAVDAFCSARGHLQKTFDGCLCEKCLREGVALKNGHYLTRQLTSIAF